MSVPHFYRCPKHALVAAHNQRARFNTEIDTYDAECGACIMLEVAWIRNVVLMDVLDTLAEFMRHHAMLRERITQLELRLSLLNGPGQLGGGILHHDS